MTSPHHASAPAVAAARHALPGGELRRQSAAPRLLFTVAALLLYRLGTYIPLPGVDPPVWEFIFRTQAGGLLGHLNVLAAGGIQRMAIFALNLTPFISASIITGVLTIVFRPKWSMNKWTRYLTALLAALQSYGIAVGLEDFGEVVDEPGLVFRLSTVTTLTGGTMFLVWLGDQITVRGVGNGIVLIVMTGVLVQLPWAIAYTLELGRVGVLSTGSIVGVVLLLIAVIAFIVFMEGARRRPQVAPGRQPGDMALRLNGSGATAPICAAGTHGLLEAALTALFAFLFTRVASPPTRPATKHDVLEVFNTPEAAETPGQHDGAMPDVRLRPGTAAYVDHVRTRITVVGAAYLAAACLLPEFLLGRAGLPFSGSLLLIVVIGALDTLACIRTLVRLPGLDR